MAQKVKHLPAMQETWVRSLGQEDALEKYTHPAILSFDFIEIVHLLPSHCGFFLVFEHGVSSFCGFQCPSVNGCSTASCNFGVLTGGDESTSFYSAILNRRFLIF